ncbi:MAG: cytidine deaminase [Bacteroidetes bacterium]|nr:MAG: cytidine deaminase [Bacteroidota bacterium]
MQEHKIYFETYKASADLPTYAQALWQKAQEASQLAYAPYSHFFVGTAILLMNGDIIMGANQENAAYPSGLCAERVAFFQYGMKPASPIKAVAIVARNQANGYVPASPCGACRQVMAEYRDNQAHDFELFFQANADYIYHLPNALDLLPIRFGAKNLVDSETKL